MNASGMNAFQASPDNQAVAYPSWNPNSTMVAFWSMNGQDSEIRAYSLATNLSYHVAGSGPFAVQTAPAWSPNGSLLAFFENGGVPQLMVFDFNTGVSTPVANASGSYLAATWASDDELLYSTAAGGYNQIMWLSMSTGTGGQLLNGSANFVSPIVGLSGQLAFYSDLNPGQNSDYLQGYGGYDVWVSGVDGSNTMFQYSLVHETEGSEQIVEVPYIPGVIDTSVQPAWSPDGTEIVYTAFSAAEGNFLYLWNLSSATTTLIGPFGVGSNACQPSWNPNGMSVAFSSDLGGSYHIWVTNMNGTPASTGNGGY
jgi:TolB protein